MYHPDLIAADEAKVNARFRAIFPTGLPRYSVADSAALTASIVAAVDDHGSPIRPLTDEEQRFVGSSRLRVIYDFPYFAERFVWIDMEGHGLRRLSPLWESQKMVLDQLAAIELSNR